jgi:ribosome-associated protein
MAPNMENLLAEVSFKTSRSGGSGGQHVNKVSTKVELDFDVLESKALTDEEKALISEKLTSRLTSDGILQVISQSERSQLRNKKVALEKFQELIQACFIVPKKRKPSKVPRRVKEKRLFTKKMKAEIKKLRRKDF